MQQKHDNRRLLRLVGTGLLTAASLVQGATAAELTESVKFDIEPQALETALLEFSKQAGIQVFGPAQGVTGKKAPGIRGEQVVEDALKSLLKDAGLTYRMVNKQTVAIGPADRPDSPVSSLGESAAMQLAQGESTTTASPDAAQPPIASSTKDDAIETVIVTAQKREQRIIDVPMSIGVLSSEEIERKGISNVVDLSFAVPGMMVQQFAPGRAVIYMRGIGNFIGSESSTSVYFDEVSVSSGAIGAGSIGQLDLATTDLERIEVLKGPQGTLYGAGAVGGTVRFITADPKLDAFGAKGDVTALFTEDGAPSQKASAVLNAPVVTDVFGLRLAATFEDNGGWIDRPSIGRSDVNESRLADVRLKGLWRPSDALDVRATAVIHRNRDGDSGGNNHSDADGNFELPVDPFREYPFKDDYELYNLTATYDFGAASLLASSSYTNQDASFLFSSEPGPDTLFLGIESITSIEQRKKRFTQEIRLSSTEEQALKWTVGGYYQDVKDENENFSETFFDEAWGGPFLLQIPSRGKSNSTSWAAFADGTYAMTDRLEVGAGVRYFEDERSSDDLLSSVHQGATFDKATWRVNSRYSLTDYANVYASIATGFRSGGFNIAGNPPFQPEELITYELGSKIQFPAGNGNLDFALFYSDYRDYLRNGWALIDGRFITTIGNIGTVRVQGAELSGSVAPTENLTLFFNGTYIDAEITSVETVDPQNTLARPGDTVDFIPKFSYTLGAEHGFSWTNGVPGFFRVDYSYRDPVSVINRALMLIPAMVSDDISLLQARLGLTRNRWSVELFGENLMNENGSFDPFPTWNQAIRNRPRTYGLKVGVEF